MIPTAMRSLRGSDHVRSVTPAGTPIAAPATKGQSLCQFRASRNFQTE